jgi:hypothetical protein
MSLRETATLKQQQFLKALEEFVARSRILSGAQRVGGDRIGARPRPRSMRPGNSASSTLKRSATMSGA